MYRKLLAVAICTALAVPAWAHESHMPEPTLADTAQTTTQQATSNQNTQSRDQDQSDQENEQPTKLKTITVTGSLIPRSQIETATPTIQITNEEIKRKGFATVADALQALPQATGNVQGAQFSGGFTQGAQTISLLGLDPSFTLFLIDGKPMADYPLLYNGSGNFVDISNIPMAMVDHIDIVPGNQSAIYGSSAIAGVINIVLKKHIEGFTMDLRGGGFSEGGGGSQRLQFTGGHDWGKANLIYSVELTHQQPIYRYQRDWFDSLNDRPGLQPGETRHGLDYLLQDLFYDQIGTQRFLVAGGPSACEGVAKGFKGTEEYFADPAGRGHACGSPLSPAYSTMMNGYKSATGYLRFTYDFSPTAELYADVLYNVRNIDYYTGSRFTWWGSGADVGALYAANVDNGSPADGPGTFISTQYTIDSSAVGIGDAANEKDLNRSYVANLGVRGSLGNSDWTYDAYFHRSDYVTLTRQEHLIADKVDHYFLGDPIGMDPVFGVYPVYNLNLDRFYSIMSPKTYRSLSGQIRTRSHTYTQEVSGVVTNTNLFDLSGGSAGIAMLLQYGNQLWDNPTDPRVIDGYFWGRTGTQGYGKRDRYAAAVEMTLPVATWLTVDASARYDTYKASGRKDSKLTYKVGLEWRPIDTLLVRGTYATAFRAPDMAALYQGPSGFYTNVVDYYRCRVLLGDNFDVDACPYNNVQTQGTQKGNLELKNITAKSITAGFVWSPTSNFNIHADYYKIEISDEVSQRSISGIVQLEADCRIGHTRGGTSVDPNSPRCQDANALVDRSVDPNDPLASGISVIHTYPINVSAEMVKGATAGAQYRWNAGAAGDFLFGANYNVQLEHTYKQYPGDPTLDLLSLAYQSEFRSRASAQISWHKSRWGITLYGNRVGSMANYDEDARLGPWITYNVSVNYQANDQVQISVISNNVTNKRPPRDPTHTAYPYYNGFAYNGYGRSIFAELNWKFF